MELRAKIIKRLEKIYKGDYPVSLVDTILEKIISAKSVLKQKNNRWTERDIILITYGDSIQSETNRPLKTLSDFIESELKNIFSIIHILPFFPSSSDDGFSVINYREVDSNLGEWMDIQKLSINHRIMGDLVINHVSQKSNWFQNFLKDQEPGRNYFIAVDPLLDLSSVVRPRSLPLLTRFETTRGTKYIWTTFSADQIDLNFSNPVLLSEMIAVFLFYLAKGISVIRLDAIAFLWKEQGTNCLHRPETHEVVKLLRDIAEYIDPSIILITETNVPNDENLSYFGNNDEAHMVYNFSLPPLILHSLFSGDSTHLSEWASTLPELNTNCTFLNFTASHDGIGVRPLEGILPPDNFFQLITGMKEFGGMVNTRRNAEGKDIPYELNITYFEALKGTLDGPDNWQVERFVCSQTIMCSMKGIPAIYINSILGGSNYTEGVKKTGMNRTINRQKWDSDLLKNELTSDTVRSTIFSKLHHILSIRKNTPEFHPDCDQEILFQHNCLFILKRSKGQLVSVSNISRKEQKVIIEPLLKNSRNVIDLLSGARIKNQVILRPYQTIWLKNSVDVNFDD